MDNNVVRKMACYAVLQSGFSNENYLDSHLKLVLALLYSKNYKVVKIEKVIYDFFEEYKYEIPMFPMRVILGMACSQGYIQKKHNCKEYICSDKINSLQNMAEEIQRCESDFVRLAQEYMVFLKTKYQVEIDIYCAEIVLSEQICEKKLEQITNRLNADLSDGSSRYFFACFQQYLQKEKVNLYDVLKHMCVGSILVDYLTYHEDIGDKKRLDGLTVVLDTPVAFRFLGIDLLKDIRYRYYVSLVESAICNGAKIVIFRNTYDEMTNILSGTAEWVENRADYDPSLASTTTEYFRNIDATRADVIDFSNSLKDILQKSKVEILDWNYSKDMYQFNPDILKIEELLKNAYDKQNAEYNENSLVLDANSIAAIYLLRKQAKPQHLSDAKYVFVTSNVMLAKVAYNYHNDEYSTYIRNEQTFGTVVTDTFFGTYMWLSNPTQINNMSSVRMMANAYAAVHPSHLMLKKLVDTVNKLYNDKKITEIDCYLLKGDLYVREKIMQKTFGDINKFTEQTPMEIMNEIRQEARREGRNEAIKAKEQEIIQINNKHDEENLKHCVFEKELLEYKKKNLIDIKKRKEEQKKKIEKKWRCLRHTIGTIMVLVAIVVGGDGYFYNLGLETEISFWNNKRVYAIPLLGLGMYIFIGKEIDCIKILLQWINNLKNDELSNKRCRECDIESVQKDIENVDNSINKL